MGKFISIVCHETLLTSVNIAYGFIEYEDKRDAEVSSKFCL